MNNLPKELISSIKDYVIDNKVLKNLLLLNIELKTVIPKNYSYTRAEDYNCLTCIEPTLINELDFSVLGKSQPYSIKELQTGTHIHIEQKHKLCIEIDGFYWVSTKHIEVCPNTIMTQLYGMYTLNELKLIARENIIKGRSKLKTRQDYKNALLKL